MTDPDRRIAVDQQRTNEWTREQLADLQQSQQEALEAYREFLAVESKRKWRETGKHIFWVVVACIMLWGLLLLARS